MAKKASQFQTIRTEGALLPPDILRLVTALKVDGALADDYHLPPGSKINEAISQSWTVLLSHWKSFQEARLQLAESEETATKLTNERWLLPLFKELDYGRLTTEKSPVIDDRTYPIERSYQHTPIHLIGCRLPLDRRTKGARGAATASPYSMVQEYLNRSDKHLWAFLSNGLQLRILRDNISLSRQAFVEFDLEAMFEGEIYSDFAILWLLCHQSRVEAENPTDCWLEKWSKLAKDQGTRVLNQLRNGVANAISALGQGFIAHPKNDTLRERLQSGALSKDDFYRQLLRIVYRLLFLFVAEDRELLHPLDGDEAAKQLYDKYYSTRRLRDLSRKIRGSRHSDLWHSLSLVFAALSKNDGCPQLAITGLGSFLWRNESTPDLLGPQQAGIVGLDKRVGNTNVDLPNSSLQIPTPSIITNDDLLLAVRSLAYTEQNNVLRSVDYRNLGSEEFGSVYESLLELHPIMHVEAKSFSLDTAAGNERKTSGSYYSPDPLVQELLDSALEPVIKQRLQEAKDLVNRKESDKGILPTWYASLKLNAHSPLSYSQLAEQALLALKICDPACGSGHFLIAAAHRLARHLARIRTGESEPGPEEYQHALRDVIGRCIYGVDLNPMAVELCKVSLWMEAMEPGKPLSFLDHHIQCGNSLLGCTPALLEFGISPEAFKPIEGDDKAIVSKLKKQNQRERDDRKSGQRSLFEPFYKLGNLPSSIASIDLASDDSVDAISAKQAMYEQMVKDANYLSARLLADMWCASFVWRKTDDDLGWLCPSEQMFRQVENNPHSCSKQVKDEVQRLARLYQFFHWQLAFPDVFQVAVDAKSRHVEARDSRAFGISPNSQLLSPSPQGWIGGFDVVLGNPPWERVKLQEREWFAERCPTIAKTPNAAARKRMIAGLQAIDPMLYQHFLDDSRKAEGESHLIRSSGRYPLCGRGDINVYSIFAEGMRTILNAEGRAGCILPSGIATDDTTKFFFQEVIESQSLVSLFDFENKGIFPGVHSSYKFCLFTTGSGLKPSASEAEFVFFAHRVDELQDPTKRMSMSLADIVVFNPESMTCPVFATRRDYELVRRLHLNCATIERKWQGYYIRLIHLGDHAAKVHLRAENPDTAKRDDLITLYEAKLFHHFNHRFATFADVPDDTANIGIARGVTINELLSPEFSITPRYFVESDLFEEILSKYSDKCSWLLGYRDICRSTDERTCISGIIPRCPTTVSVPCIGIAEPMLKVMLAANLACFCLDYVTRQKVAGTHLSWGIFKQLPLLEPERFSSNCSWSSSRKYSEIIQDIVLELSYNSWDLQSFGLDCEYDGPPFQWKEERRFLLRCELDAAFFHLYLRSDSIGDWRIVSKQEGSRCDESPEDFAKLKQHFPTPRDAVHYIMETFPIVKRKDIARTEVKDAQGNVIQPGTYITKDTILSIYDEMATAIRTGQPYQSLLNPPPGPPTDANGNFIPYADWTDEIHRRYADVIHFSRDFNRVSATIHATIPHEGGSE